MADARVKAAMLIGVRRLVVPNVIRVGPLQELKIGDKSRFYPNAHFHLCGGEPLPPSAALIFEEVREWVGLDDVRFEQSLELTTRRRNQASTDPSSAYQFAALVISHNQGVDRVLSSH